MADRLAPFILRVTMLVPDDEAESLRLPVKVMFDTVSLYETTAAALYSVLLGWPGEMRDDEKKDPVKWTPVERFLRRLREKEDTPEKEE